MICFSARTAMIVDVRVHKLELFRCFHGSKALWFLGSQKSRVTSNWTSTWCATVNDILEYFLTLDLDMFYDDLMWRLMHSG